MKKLLLKSLALFLVAVMVISAFASCEEETGKQNNDAQSEKEETSNSEKTSDEESESDESASDDNAIGTEGLAYKLLKNNTYEVSAGSAKEATEIVIPSRYNGKPVTSIGDSAFYACTGLTSIDIPDSVTSIGSFAFHYCIGLTSIDVPDSVKSIGDSAFAYCTGLTSIDIPDSVTSIGAFAFSDCIGLTSVTIGNGVEIISDSVFSCCDGLTSIKFRITEAEWNAIEKGDNWNENVPEDCQIIFNYTGE